VKLRTLAIFTSAVALTAMSPAIAGASVVHPLTTCWYTITDNVVNSTRIEVTATPQCAGEAAAQMILWIYIPISHGDSYVAAGLGNPTVLTYNCAGGDAPNTFDLQVSGGTPANTISYGISDDCGPVEP
jgi:hypothetical protein